MKKFVKIGIASVLAVVLFTQAVPTEIWGAIAEGFTIEENEGVLDGNWTDKGNVDGDIIEEDISKRTETTKEFIMSNDMRLVQQFAVPVHYYKDGKYEEIQSITDEKELSSITENNLHLSKKNFSVTNIYEDGTKITTGNEVYAGKNEKGVKSDVFFRFQLPEQASQYTLVDAQFNFNYHTKGMGFLDAKNLGYDVYLADSKTDINSITYESKPQKIQSLKGISKKIQLTEKEVAYESMEIDVNNIEDGTLTIGIECVDTTSEDACIAIPMTVESAPSIAYTYRNVLGIENSYDMESFNIDGASAYVNTTTGYLTVACDLASVETFSSTVFASSLVYNYGYNSVLEEFGIPHFGNHFKLNFQQYMKKSSGGNCYEWVDADGTVVTFYQDETDSTLYKAKSKYLYFKESANGTGELYDAQKNQLFFENGRLTEITRFKENNYYTQPEWISIEYASSSSDRITKIAYGENSTQIYQILFTYDTAGIAQTVSTYSVVNNQALASYELLYTDGNLTAIRNVNADVNELTLSYMPIGENEGDFAGELASVFNCQKEGLDFSISSDNQTYKVCNLIGKELYNIQFRMYDHTEFNFDNTRKTEIYYYHNNQVAGEKHVAFNNARMPISSWTKDSDGVINVCNDLNWTERESQSYTSTYEQTTCAYRQSPNTSARGEKVLHSGGKWEFTASASDSGITENSSVYKYALNFKANSSAPLNLSVQIGSTTKTVSLEYGGELYISIPCGYLSSNTDITITNNDEYDKTISDVCYTLTDCTRTVSEYDSATQRYGLTEQSVYQQAGKYTRAFYNTDQLVTYALESTTAGTSSAKQSTYTYCTANDWTKNKVSSIVTQNASGEQVSRVDYTYDKEGVRTQEVVEVTQGELHSRAGTVVNKYNTIAEIIQTDENYVTTRYNYGIRNGDFRLIYKTSGDTFESYEYNDLGQVTNVSIYDQSTNPSTLVYSQTDTYDNGMYVGSSYGGTDFTHVYDNEGLVTSIKQGADTMLEYSYNATNGYNDTNALRYKCYANGDKESYSYGSNDIQITHGSGDTYWKAVNNEGEIQEQKHYINYTEQLRYQYTLNNPTSKRINAYGTGVQYNFTYVNNYDQYKNRATSMGITVSRGSGDIEEYSGNYSYDDKGRISSSTYGRFTTQLSYDDKDRISTYVTKINGYTTQNKTYTYRTYSANGTSWSTNQLVKIEEPYNSAMTSTATYDTNGRVSTMTSNNVTHTYTYDAMGRLSSENSTSYTYDANGNITQRNNNGSVTNYVYDSKGRLTQAGSEYFSYDSMGNPTYYKGNSFTWEQGRKLVRGNMNENNFAYTYDGNGMRYKKVVNNKTTEYYLNGSQIMVENRIDNGGLIFYIYDATGIAGMIYNSQTYSFDKNVLGDVIGIRDLSGTLVGEYQYDAWGNITYQYGSMAEINPFRYRGYYYDTETGFYYLQTRYYDPSIMRFINADNYELVSQLASSKELNMYVYCRNNPIMHTDPTGEGWILALVIIGVGALVGGAINGVTSYNAGNRGWNLVLDVAIGASAGAAIAGGALMTGGVFIGAIQSIGGAFTLSTGLIQMTAMGTAGFNLGGFIMAALQGIKTPEPVEFPSPPQAPTYYTPITGY